MQMCLSACRGEGRGRDKEISKVLQHFDAEICKVLRAVLSSPQAEKNPSLNRTVA